MTQRRSSYVTPIIFGLLLFAIALAFGPNLIAPKPEQSNDVALPGSESLQESFQGNFTLAVSWQPAFCETRARLPECKSQTKNRFDASHFTLHGLWPEPASNVYCNVDRDVQSDDIARNWRYLPDLDLSVKTTKDLSIAMPGTVSYLERHEWVKHGTCTGVTPQSYFAASLALLDALNASPVRELFVGNIGRTLTADAVRKAFDQAFGKGTGSRIALDCVRDGNRQLIGEIRIALSGTIDDKPDLGKLMQKARSKGRGCSSGMIDRIGLQ